MYRFMQLPMPQLPQFLNAVRPATGQSSRWVGGLLSSLAVGATLWWGLPAQAASVAAPANLAQAPANQTSAPAELTQIVEGIEAAASDRNVQDVLQYYSADFVHSDGLTYSDLEEALTQFWVEYPDVTYETDIQSWEPDGSGYMANTVTYITGTRQTADREVTLEATIESRQRYEGGLVVQQTVLSEENKVTTGINPPTVEVNLPSQIGIGQEFNFDVIVQEPLGNRLLLGSAIEAPVESSGYFEDPALELEALTAGGIFKIGEAPLTSDNRWISAVLIREDGIITISKRLQIGASAAVEPVDSMDADEDVARETE